jgi:gas vesicle protein
MKSFLAGLGLGFGLGVLFAPMSGDETRQNISDRANDLASSARQTYTQGRDRVQRGIDAVRGTADRAMNDYRGTTERAVNEVRENLNQVTGTSL